MKLTEKALAAAVLEICKLNEENRAMHERLDATISKLSALNKENLERSLRGQTIMHVPYAEHPNCLCSLSYSENAERSAKDATQ